MTCDCLKRASELVISQFVLDSRQSVSIVDYHRRVALRNAILALPCTCSTRIAELKRHADAMAYAITHLTQLDCAFSIVEEYEQWKEEK